MTEVVTRMPILTMVMKKEMIFNVYADEEDNNKKKIFIIIIPGDDVIIGRHLWI